MSIFSKIGKVLKKIAAPVLGIAGTVLGGPAGGAIGSAIGGLFKGSSAQSMADPNVGPQQESVPVTGQSNGTNWAPVLGAAASGIANYVGTNQQNAANAQQAQQQMDFQKEMSNTSYQRGMADMKSAGLNPILAYSQGGASTPGGAQASMNSDIGEGANSAFSAAQTIQQMQSAAAGIEKTHADTSVSEQQAALIAAQRKSELNRPENIAADTVLKGKHTERGEAEIRATLLRSQLLRETMEDQKSEISSAAKLRGWQAMKEKLGISEHKAMSNFWDSDVGKASPYLRLGTEAASSAVGTIGKAMRLGKFGF